MSVYGKLNETDLSEQALLIGGREQSMRYLVQLSRSTPAFSATERSPENERFGCEARVWMMVNDTTDGRLKLSVDSEARVVKALLLIVASALDGATRAQVAAYDLDAHLQRVGLGAFLTASRRNGLRSVLLAIKER
ncbi:MAG TPA: SufE family protein [Pseudidiomarina sp.]|nr:SufE family protein [Pseudidiomarina sp.]